MESHHQIILALQWTIFSIGLPPIHLNSFVLSSIVLTILNTITHFQCDLLESPKSNFEIHCVFVLVLVLLLVASKKERTNKTFYSCSINSKSYLVKVLFRFVYYKVRHYNYSIAKSKKHQPYKLWVRSFLSYAQIC